MITVGPGIQVELTKRGDHAIVNSKFYDNNDHSNTEYVIGTKGEYYATNTTGEWVTHFFPKG